MRTEEGALLQRGAVLRGGGVGRALPASLTKQERVVQRVRVRDSPESGARNGCKRKGLGGLLCPLQKQIGSQGTQVVWGGGRMKGDFSTKGVNTVGCVRKGGNVALVVKGYGRDAPELHGGRNLAWQTEPVGGEKYLCAVAVCGTEEKRN